MLLYEYAEQRDGLTYVWMAGVGCPAGEEYNHVPWESADDNQPDNEIDFSELDVLDKFMSLNGSIEGHGQNEIWVWDGEGNPTDFNGNSYYSIKAR